MVRGGFKQLCQETGYNILLGKIPSPGPVHVISDNQYSILNILSAGSDMTGLIDV